ncbi:MAG: isopeptide-forming domain-containing fimbrial protein [Christensenellales bacterium]
MKRTKKPACFLLALLMVFALAAPALAAENYTITVKNNNPAVSIGQNTYTAYRLFGVTYGQDKSSYAYTVTKEFEGFSYTAGGTVYSGEALIDYLSHQQTDSETMNAVAKAALAYINAQNIQPSGTAKASGETAVIRLSSPGYYLVFGTATAPEGQTITAACSLTTTDPAAEINVKADAPSLDKKIDQGTAAGVYDERPRQTRAAWAIPAVCFASTVPQMTGYEKYYFVVRDTLSKGLTFNEDEITLGQTLLSSDAYTVTHSRAQDGSTEISIVFRNFIQYKQNAGQDITLCYSATINQNAVIGNLGNPNTASLTHSNNPHVADSGTPENPDFPTPNSPVGQTPESRTVTYVSGLRLTKIDNSPEGKILTGAKFELKGTSTNGFGKRRNLPSAKAALYRLKDGTYTQTPPVTSGDEADTSALYDSTTITYEKINTVTKNTETKAIATEGWVNSRGELTFSGLGAGTYTITELVSPAGYNLLKQPITITLSWTDTPTQDGQYWSAQKGSGDEAEPLSIDGETFHFAFEVVNNTGAMLPSTGGMGTALFYVLGAAMVLGAAGWLVYKKRMNAKNQKAN